jgi:hypothetical protein
MNKLLVVAFACAVRLSAQSGITFSLSTPKEPTKFGWKVGTGPVFVLTVKKSDPRPVDMFTFEVVDAEGNVKCRYYRINENNVAPVIEADATEWKTYPFLGDTTADMVLSVRNPKVVFAGEDDPIVNQRNADIKAGRKFKLWEAVGPPKQTDK